MDTVTRRGTLQWALAAATSKAPRTFVLVHGSWHGAWCFREVERRLRAAGHDVFVPTLTGLADRAHLLSRDVNLSTHVEDVASLIEVEELKDVCLLGHSYAGLVITGAAARVPKRIGELVYLDAFVPQSGQSGFDCMSAKFATSWRKRAADEGEGFKVPLLLDAKSMGIMDPSRAAWVDRKLTPMPLDTFEEKLTFDEAAWEKLNRRYIRCRGFPGFGPTAERVRKLGWRVQELECGHDAMLADADGLARALME